MWKVLIHKTIEKKRNLLPKVVKAKLDLLLMELKLRGPIRNNWNNYGALRGKRNLYHCHIKKGKPTYVVVWEVKDKQIKLMEVIYVGTHEKAPY